MKEKKHFIWTGGLLIILSVVFLFAHYMIFGDLETLSFYLVLDLAFIPLEIFFVSFIIERFLEKREKQQLQEKLNMLIGLFYAELGANLMHLFVKADPKIVAVNQNLKADGQWHEDHFNIAKEALRKHDFHVNIKKINLLEVRDLVAANKTMLVNFLSNPSLLENVSFSDTLLSVFHINEELLLRKIDEDITRMNEEDVRHLELDIQRAYKNMAYQWTDYMLHLKNKYPYLYVTACKENPFY